VRALFALLLIACGPDSGKYPPGTAPLIPGQGGTTNPPDAAPAPVGDAGASGIVGQLCATTDVRSLGACTGVTSSTLTVTALETGDTATADATGHFVLPAIGGQAQITLVTSTNDRTWFGGARTVALSAGGAVVTLPVMRKVDVADLAAANTSAVIPGAGILVVHTIAGATLDPIGGVIPYYDAGDPRVFSPNPPTGPTGTALFFDLVGPVTTTLRAGTRMRTLSATVVADTLTFVEALF
jgi:hypothetical protein